MTLGVVGRKCGMTRIFTEEGLGIPVTVIEVLPNRVTQIKSREKEGYNALQVTTGERSAKHLTKASVGHFAKAGVEAGRGLWEFSLEDEGSTKLSDFGTGSEITVAIFKEGQRVDVKGISKGKGYGGVIKKHHFASQDSTHGNSLSHRAPGSIGQRQSPGRVFKGKKMAGQLGNKQCTIQSQEVVRVDKERNLLLVKGVVPGAPGSTVIVVPAARHREEK